MNEETVQTLLTTYIQVVIDTWPDEGPVPNSDSNLPWRAVCRAAGDADTLACYETARRANKMIHLARDCSSKRRPWKDCLKSMIAQAQPDMSIEIELSRLRDAARAVLKEFQAPPNPTVVCGPIQVGRMLNRGGYTPEQIKAMQDLQERLGN